MSHKLVGKRFGKLLVVGRAGSNRQGSITWLCKCDCGNETRLSSDHLTRKIGSVTSCGCNLKRRGKYNPLFDGVGDISKSWWHYHILREIAGKRRNMLVDLTMEEAWSKYKEQGGRCAITGLQITIGNHDTDHASIDRIDNTIGYTVNNIQWVHKDINMMKRIYSMQYFYKLCKLVYKNNMDRFEDGTCEF